MQIFGSARRLVGSVSLFLALMLLVLGQTLLLERLTGLIFLIYWLGCFFFTLLAFGAAMVDYRFVKKQARRMQRDLVIGAVREIEASCESKQTPREGGSDSRGMRSRK